MKTSTINKALIEACLANRRQAQRRLYDLSLPNLTFLIKRYLNNEAELKDTLQETYLSIYQHLSQFNPERGSFNTWSGRIAINNCIRRNKAGVKSATEALDTEMLNRPCTDPGPLTKLTDEELLGWIKAMPRDYYLVFNLHAVEGYQHQEISELLNITPDLSRQRLSRAKGWLRKESARYPDGPLSNRTNWRPDTLVASLAFTIHIFLNS